MKPSLKTNLTGDGTHIIVVLLKGLVMFLLFFPLCLHAQQLAFPTAEGFGRFASGGRGGTVYHVTNLNDSGPGSFRDAVSQPSRTVVFDVGGIIRLNSRVVVSHDITIAGQTAPGDGICIYGDGLSYSNANNTITRHIRFRMGRVGTSGADAITIATGQNMIFDHVSVSWGRDGTFDINGDVGDVTIQNSIIGQGLQTHSTGGLIQSTGGISILRSLYIDNQERNPKVKGYNQYVNNVVYNWIVSCYILGDSEGLSYANVQNNYFIDGPETGDTPPFNRANENFNLYADNNWHDGNENGILDGAIVPVEVYGPVTWVPEPFDYPEVTMMTPLDAYNNVISHAGASLHRDQVDAFMIDEMTSLGTKGHTISDELTLPTNGPGLVRGGPSLPDTDLDGIPDYWEDFFGLNKNNPDDRNGDDDGDGYTNLEEYLNCLTGECEGTVPPLPPREPATFTFVYDNSGHHEWDWFNNWDLGYAPVAGDTAIIMDGEVQIGESIPGIMVKVERNGTVNVTGDVSVDNIVLEGGKLVSFTDGETVTLTANIQVVQPSQIGAGMTASSTLQLKGMLSGEGNLIKTSDGQLSLNNDGIDFSGDWSLEAGSVLVSNANASGTGQVNVNTDAKLIMGNLTTSSIAFLYLKDGGKISVNSNVVLPGGKFGKENLARNSKYTASSRPDFIEGTGSIRISKTGSYDCYGVWNGTAYRDDCYACVEGVTGRTPCYTDLPEGVYKLTPSHSEYCVADGNIVSQDTCKTIQQQAWMFSKLGNFYRVSSLQSNEFIDYTLAKSPLSGKWELYLTTRNFSLNAFRIERIGESFLLMPALTPDITVGVENSSSTAGTGLLLEKRTASLSQQFVLTPYVDCHGDAGGLAEMDKCGICSGGNTGIDPCKGSIQAEDFCSLDGVIETTNGGYFGDSYVNFDNAAGTKATYFIVSEVPQTVTFNLRFANGTTGNRNLKVLVNGEEQVANLEIPSTNSWTNWVITQATVDLDTGYNVLTFEALSSNGGPNLDIITYSADGILKGDCSIPTDCNGVIFGNAVVDACGICTGGNTGVVPCAGAIQAEDFCSLDGVTETVNGGYLGDSYVNLDNRSGTTVTYYIVSADTQTFSLKVRYANGTTSGRNMKVLVNNEVQIAALPMPPTGAWTTWVLADAPVTLQRGYNVVAFESLSSSGGPNLDMLSYYVDGITLGDCNAVADCHGDLGGTAQVDSCGVCSGGNTGIDPNGCLDSLQEGAQVVYYPNPFTEVITLETEGVFNYSVYRISDGQIVEQDMCDSGTCAAGLYLPPDDYLVVVSQEGRSDVAIRVTKE